MVYFAEKAEINVYVLETERQLRKVTRSRGTQTEPIKKVEMSTQTDPLPQPKTTAVNSPEQLQYIGIFYQAWPAFMVPTIIDLWVVWSLHYYFTPYHVFRGSTPPQREIGRGI